ncbi:hypothetical protein Tco_1170224 [Tanacetum coccineum]
MKNHNCPRRYWTGPISERVGRVRTGALHQPKRRQNVRLDKEGHLFKPLDNNKHLCNITIPGIKERCLQGVPTPKAKARHRSSPSFPRLGDKGRSLSAHSESRYQGSRPRRAEPLSESEEIEGGHWKSKSRKQKSSMKEEDLSQPWTCKEENPFTPRIRYFKLLKKSRMPNNVKMYDGSYDPEDHLKIFQAAVKEERWAMPT